MKVVCYQLAAAPGTLRLSIGAHPATTVPQVDGWRIDGADVRPANLVVVRRMQSVRQGRLPPGDRPRAFSGVYDITGVAGPAYPKLEVRVDGRLFERTLRSLPRRLEIDGPGLNVLLVSCFHYSTDGGLYGELLPRIVQGAADADLCVFMGDQVYLDLPTLQNFPDDPAGSPTSSSRTTCGTGSSGHSRAVCSSRRWRSSRTTTSTGSAVDPRTTGNSGYYLTRFTTRPVVYSAYVYHFHHPSHSWTLSESPSFS